MIFVIKNKNQFRVNSEIYNMNTRQHYNFHQRKLNLTKYRKGIHYLGLKIYNNLLSQFKDTSNNN